MITVVNKRTHRPTNNDIYIGRGSSLGNPYTHKAGTLAEFICESRQEAIECCRDWLELAIRTKDPAICTALNNIYKRAKQGDVNLVCYCTPLACHGEIIKGLIEEKLRPNP